MTCGAFTPAGDFLELPQFDMERLLVAWQDAVFALYLAEEKIEPELATRYNYQQVVSHVRGLHLRWYVVRLPGRDELTSLVTGFHRLVTGDR